MPVYLDNNATTPLDERVFEEMLPYLKGEFGNPSSGSHAYGWTAEAAVEVARERVADGLGASPEEVFFTSGATESDNIALRGLLSPGDHLIVSATEHEAVLETARATGEAGVEVSFLPVDGTGQVRPETLRSGLRSDTALVSIMLANNEFGTVNRIAELAEVAHERGVPLHTDAAQALGKVPLDVRDLGVEMMSLSAHKAYGPKGVGALFVRRRPEEGMRRVRLSPLISGGGQERGLRSGTLNVPGIVGFGKAAEIASAALPKEAGRIRALRERLYELLRKKLAPSGLRVNGHPGECLPNTLSLTLFGLDAGELLADAPEVAASTGSACASRDPEPSRALLALGLEPDAARSTIRLSLGRFTTLEDVEAAASLVEAAAKSKSA